MVGRRVVLQQLRVLYLRVSPINYRGCSCVDWRRGLAQSRQGDLDKSIIQGLLYQPDSLGSFNANDVNVGAWNPPTNSDAYKSLNNTSTNIANGAWTSAPGEHRAWWFGGMQSLNGGPIDMHPLPNKADAANVTSRKFLEVDMSSAGFAIFNQTDLPNNIQTSAEGALIWLPYGTNGILLAFGGIADPADMQPNGVDTNASESNNFMTNINVYDVATKKWAVQQTLEKTESPKQLAQFCTAVTTSKDGTGYFVYVYGGYDGSYGTANPIAESRDEVWVLSLPAFEWTKINTGNRDHRRQNHICVTPTPSQMISIGGMAEFEMNITNGSMIEVYDLNKNMWVDSYNPSSGNYIVPKEIVNQLQTGTSSGGFDKFSSQLDPTVNLLLQSHRAKTIVPRNRTCSAGTNPTPNSDPAWKKPVEIAVPLVIGLAVIIGLVVSCVKKKRKVADAESRTKTRQNKVLPWLFTSKHDPLPPESELTDRTENTMVGTEVQGYFGRPKTVTTEIYEAPNSNLASPISYNDSGHGTPNILASPALSGSHEVDATGILTVRHEMDGRPSGLENMSPRNHPIYPPSLAGTQNVSTAGESVSHPSATFVPNPYLGHVSPYYELRQDNSNENLSQPPNDFSLNNTSSHTDQNQSKDANLSISETRNPTTTGSTSAITRKPVNSSNPGHQRQSSSMSSQMYQLPSPGFEEDQRRSTYLDSLPDQEGRSSPGYPKRQYIRQPAGPIQSAYHENFEDFERR